ncbi:MULTISPECIES: BLUF domain-containing protein [Stenotrophomonas]|uniref:BLUF domain-containing protein n=1 Tax=Stenotrophomonas TaxID=40323 RepID=UPI00066D1B02|nr:MULTISPECIES: BLUF domain-containing protein [Stenotrophomonas]MCU1002733.1 BLUF domain-containing protein [Stenotrophomonas maltophilia]QGL98798.1 BLUF domain-containing protein [Stenotrophomonas maltophilia]
MNLRAIVYASEAIPGLSNERIHDLAQSACRFNLQAGVTGVLLYDGRRFFQYLEGPEDGMAIVYARVLAARSHHEIVELCRGRITARHFPYWSMRMLPAKAYELQAAASFDWYGVTRSAGLEQLTQIVHPYLPGSDPQAA